MITLYDIIGGVSAILENAASQAPVYKGSRDDITEPGLYIVPTSVSSVVEGMIRHDSYELSVGWYATGGDDRYIDLIEAQEIFESLFTGRIKIGESFFIYPDETSFELDAQEGTIFCTFSFEVYQMNDTSGGETAETMTILAKKEEYTSGTSQN